MSLTQAPLFKLISARMSWLAQRQVILGQNLANADTPDYRPKDLREADFARLAEGYSGRPSRITVARTDPADLEGAPLVRVGLAGREVDSNYETTPDGNAVILEEQMAKASQTALDYQLTSNLYRNMIRLALGAQP
jgi:flagellar basal-body rod protein FlgB